MALLPYIDKEKEADLKTQERAINSIMEFYQSMLVIRLGGKYREAPLGELLYVSDLENDKNREVNQCIKNIKIFSNQYDSSYANRDLAYFYLLKGKSELAENHIRKVIPMEFIELLEEKNYNSLFLREDNNQEALRAQEKSLDIVILAFRVLLEGKIIECARKLGALTENQSASIELWLSCVTPFLEFLEEQSKIAKGWEGNLKSSVKNYQTNLNSVLKKASNMARFSKSAFGIIKYMAQLEKEASQNQDLILEKEELKSLKFLSKCSKLTKNLEHLLLRSENKEKLELNVLPPSQTPVNSKEKSVLLQEETTKEIAARIEKINKEAQEKKKKHKAALQPRLTLKQDEQSFEGEEKEENEINLEQGGRKNYLHIDLSKLNKVLKDAKIDDDEIIGYLKQAEDYNTNNKTYAGSAGHRGVKHLFKMKLEDEHCSVYRLRGNNNEERVLLIKKGEELLPLCADKYFHKRKNGEIMKEVRQAATQLGLCFNKEQNNKVNKPTTSPYPYFQELVSSTTTTMQLM